MLFRSIALDGKIVNKYMTEINATKIKNISKDILHEKEDGMSPLMVIKDIFFKKDGSIVVVTEHTYTEEVPTGQNRTVTVYHADDNIVLSFDPKGTLKWATVVPKLQSGSQTPSSVGVRCLFKNDNLLLVYKDVIGNFKKEPDGKPIGQLGLKSTAMTTIALITPDGKLTRKALTVPKSAEGCLYYRVFSNKISEEDFIFTSMKVSLLSGKYKLARLKIVP